MISLPKAQAVAISPPHWTSTSGAITAHPQTIAYPRSVEALQSLVRHVANRQGKLRPFGGGQSCSSIMVCDDTMVSLKHLNVPPVEVHNTGERPLVTLATGAPIGKVSALLAKHNIALPQTFSVSAQQTVGGVISAGGRGSNAIDTPLHAYITAVELVDGQGFRKWVTDQDELRALRCGLGVLGIITRVAIKAIKLRNVAVTRVNVNAQQVLEDFDMHIVDHDHAWIDWQPMSNRAQLTLMDLTNIGVQQHPEARIRNTIRAMVPTIGAALPIRGRLAALGAAALWSTEQEIAALNDAVAPTDVYGVHHIGATVPWENFHAAVYGSFEIMERLQIRSPLPVRMIASKKDTSAMLSPSIGDDGITIWFSALPMSKPGQFFKALSLLLRELGGRPDWSGVHTLTHEDLAALYPELDDFNKIRKQYDPANVFLSPEMATLLTPN